MWIINNDDQNNFCLYFVNGMEWILWPIYRHGTMKIENNCIEFQLMAAIHTRVLFSYISPIINGMSIQPKIPDSMKKLHDSILTTQWKFWMNWRQKCKFSSGFRIWKCKVNNLKKKPELAKFHNFLNIFNFRIDTQVWINFLSKIFFSHIGQNCLQLFSVLWLLLLL